jgi:hypothetical protein
MNNSTSSQHHPIRRCAIALAVFAAASTLAGCGEARAERSERAAAMSAASEEISRLTVARNYWNERAGFESRRGAVLARQAYGRGVTDGFSKALGSVRCDLSTDVGSEPAAPLAPARRLK